MQFGFKELNEDEKDSLFDVLSAAAAEIPDLCEGVKDLGSHSSALLAVGFAGYKFFRSRHEYKKFIQHFENESKKLIPCDVDSEESDQIFKTVENYIKKIRNEEKKLSFYYLHKEKAHELVDCFFKECDKALNNKKISDEALRSVLTNLVSILLQNNKGVMLLTELSDITKDILDRLKQDGKNIDILKSDVEALKKALDELAPNYMTYINNAELPSVITSNIFSFRNPNITFCGRENELTRLKEWLKCPGVSVWGITGPGGIGKSRLALHLAQLDDADWKSVWLDAALLKALLDCTEFNCNKPVLFICDYASQYEAQLEVLIDKMSWSNTNAKFLFLERSDSWYKEFRRKKDIIKEHSPKEPIELEKSFFSDDDYLHIMQDISNYEYDGQIIPEDAKNNILKTSRELSNGNDSVRCLFLMLITDAYLRNENISTMNADALLLNYIIHSKNIISAQYGEVLADCGFRVLAYATAFDGIKWEDEHSPIQNDLDTIMENFPDNRYKINTFFSQLSEIENAEIVSALKPDLIGEFLFLQIWKELFKKSKIKWFSLMICQSFCQSFFARCITDWKEESETLSEILFDPNNEISFRVNCANVVFEAVRSSFSEADRMALVRKLKALDKNDSVYILVKFTAAVQFIFDDSTKDTKTECINILDNVDWGKYIPHTDKELLEISIAFSNAANVYTSQGEYQKAIGFYNKTLVIIEDVLGSEHPETATIYNNLAIVFQDMSNYSEALKCYEKALFIREKVLGTEHPDTASTYNNLALLYNDIGDFKMSLLYYKQAMTISEKILGTDHPDTATIYNNIAMVYQSYGDYATSLIYFKKALSIREKIYGTNHQITAITYDNIGCVYYYKGSYEQALRFHKKALKIMEISRGNDHPDTASIYNNIALAFNRMQKYDNALFYNTKAMKIREKYFGPTHRETGATYGNIAIVYQNKENYKKALEYAGKSLTILESVLGTEHLDTAKQYDNIGILYQKMKNYEKALLYHKKAKEIEEKVLNPLHPDLAITYLNIALALYETNNNKTAIVYAHKAENIYKTLDGCNYPIMNDIYALLFQLYFKENNLEKAQHYFIKISHLY